MYPGEPDPVEPERHALVPLHALPPGRQQRERRRHPAPGGLAHVHVGGPEPVAGRRPVPIEQAEPTRKDLAAGQGERLRRRRPAHRAAARRLPRAARGRPCGLRRGRRLAADGRALGHAHRRVHLDDGPRAGPLARRAGSRSRTRPGSRCAVALHALPDQPDLDARSSRSASPRARGCSYRGPAARAARTGHAGSPRAARCRAGRRLSFPGLAARGNRARAYEGQVETIPVELRAEAGGGVGMA